MFFSHMQQFNVETSIQDEFLTMKGFVDYLQEEYEMLVLQGFAFCSQESKGQFPEFRAYHILIMNNEAFGFVGTNLIDSKKKPLLSEKLSFSKIVKFDKRLLSSGMFEGYGSGKLEYLEASLAVDGKLYEYQQEDKLILSKRGEGNIDMFATYTILKSGEFSAYIQKNSISNAARQQAIENKLEASMQMLNKGH